MIRGLPLLSYYIVWTRGPSSLAVTSLDLVTSLPFAVYLMHSAIRTVHLGYIQSVQGIPLLE
jgi:hypothetical protein